jgi:hypothetical protein
VNEFWAFAQNYWWLAFPIMAVAGGFARRWEFSARARHKRRLEILQAKAALKAATPPKQVAHATEPKPITKASPTAAGREAVRRARRRHRAVARLRAGCREADRLPDDQRWPPAAHGGIPAREEDRRPTAARPPKAHLTDQELAAYAAAVTDYEVAFDVAEREARRLKDSDFTETERKRLATAQQLLSVAVDSAATSAERQVAYKRVREELDGLIVVSDEAIVVLEKKVALPLDAAASDAPHLPRTDSHRTPL